MKSQYPPTPVTYQESEPSNYLENYSGIRQVSIEKAEVLRTEHHKHQQAKTEYSSAPDKAEDDCLSSFFYNQTFTPSANT